MELKKIVCAALAAITLTGAQLTVASNPKLNNSCVIVADATQERTAYFSKNYTLTGNKANDVVAVAKAQVGKTGSQLKYTENWCADFATDCARLATASAIPYTYANRGSCMALYNYMINSCGATTVSPANAKKGDLVFYDWSGNKNVNNIHHVAIVESVSNGKINIIGGNQGNDNLNLAKVSRTSYATNNKNICKVVRPKYSNNNQPQKKYFNKCSANEVSIVDALKHGGYESSLAYRKKIASANNIKNYNGAAAQNVQMLNLMKNGKLIKP